MGAKIGIAALAGGVAMFVWGFVAHMLLPLGDAGITPLPHQDEILPPMGAHLAKPGMYMFPWPESSPGTPMEHSDAAMKLAEELYKTSPSGFIMFHPPGRAFLSPVQLGTEFATNVVTSALAAILVAMALGSLGSFASRVVFVTLVGLIASVAVNVPFWNWYGFPTAFTLAALVEHVVGFALVGLAVGAIVKPAAGGTEAGHGTAQ